MASRGKKRRRADGSVAGQIKGQAGRNRLIGAGCIAGQYESHEAVPPEMLRQALTIYNRHLPINREAYAELEQRVVCLDRNLDDQHDEVAALAEANGIDGSTLSLRAEKLWDFLRSPEAIRFHSIAADGQVSVHSDLLRHAAIVPTTDWSDDRLEWIEE